MALATGWALLTCQVNIPIYTDALQVIYIIIFTVRGDLWVMFCAGWPYVIRGARLAPRKSQRAF
jgi:hypothetical protein